MDISDKDLEQIRKDIDHLHDLYTNKDSQFASKKKSFVEGAHSSGNINTIHSFLTKLPASYKTAE